MEALFLKGLTRLYRGDFEEARAYCARAIAEFDDRARTAFWSDLLGEDAGVTHRCLSGARSLAAWIPGPGASRQRGGRRARAFHQTALQS